MLGGYMSINQLKEVYGVTDELFEDITPFIHEDMIGIEYCVKLNINKLDFKEILAHPYIDFEQTKAIVNLRRRTGNIKSIKELAMLDEFTPKDIERIYPYIDF
jgi:DNA uptake protein ComE-like DNA-binding protein